MKYLIQRNIFENNEIDGLVLSGLKNAVMNNKEELFLEIREQYKDANIDYNEIVDIIFNTITTEKSSAHNNIFYTKELNEGMDFKFLKYIPEEYLKDIRDLWLIKPGKYDSLDGIEYLKNLKSLKAPYNYYKKETNAPILTDIKALEKMNSLTNVELSGNDLGNLESLFMNNKNLSWIDMSACNLTSLKGIETLDTENISNIRVSDNPGLPKEILDILEKTKDAFVGTTMMKVKIKEIQEYYRNN